MYARLGLYGSVSDQPDLRISKCMYPTLEE